MKCLNSTVYERDTVKQWMADSFLQLNQDKTEIIIFVPEKCTSGIKETLKPLSAAARLLTKNNTMGLKWDSNPDATTLGSGLFQSGI